MPRILAIETSQDVCAVALRAGSEIHVREHQAARQHARLLLPMIKELFAECNLDVAKLDAIAFGRGPGSFTGVRIAVSVAQGLAFGAQCPVIALSSLQILASSAAMHLGGAADGKTIMVNQDARMGEVYSAAYGFQGQHCLPVLDDSLQSPDSSIRCIIDAESAEAPWLFTGDALSTLANTANALGKPRLAQRLASSPLENSSASAKCVLALAESAWQRGETVPALQAAPVYLRGSSAWKKSVEQAG